MRYVLNLQMKGMRDRRKHVGPDKKMKERGGESKKGEQGKKRQGGKGWREGSLLKIVKKNILSKSCPKN